jgi:type I restriction enzyme S subunit
MSKTLKELSIIHYGKSPNGFRLDESRIPIYGTGGIYGWASEPLFDRPLIVVARKGTLGRPSFASGMSWVVDTAYAVIPQKDVDAKWLYYQISNYNLESLNEATGVPSISRDFLYRVKFTDTPYPEQRKIAQILTTLDNVIEKTEALIAKYQAIKQGMMHDLFTRGVDSSGSLRPTQQQAPDLYKQVELGWIPNEWEEVTLGNELKRIEQGWSPDCEGIPAKAGQWGVLKTTAVVWDGYCDLENKVLPSILSPRPEIEVRQGDILMTRGGPNSRVGVVVYVYDTQPMLMMSDKLYRIVPKDSFDSEYLVLALSSANTQIHLSKLKTGLAESQTNISQAIVKRLKVAKPIPREQKAIADRIRSVSKLLACEQRSLRKLLTQKSGLMQDLLTGKVRVKVEEAKEVAANA